MKLVKGFSSLLYVDPMDWGGWRGCRRHWWTCGWSPRTSRPLWGRPEVLEVYPFSTLLLVGRVFFLHWALFGDQTLALADLPGSQQGEAVHSPHHRHHRLSSLTSQSHSHNTLRLLASLRRTFLRSGYRSGHYRNFCYLHFLTTSKVSWLFLVSSLTHSIQLAFHNQGSSKK